MKYRYIDSSGVEHGVADLAGLVEAVRSSAVTGQTLLFDAATQKWHRAEQLDIYEAAVALAHGSVSSGAGENALGSDGPSRSYQKVEVYPKGDDHQRAAEAASPAATLKRLEAYVGDNWSTHYNAPFTKLLMAERGVGKAKWTWNWPAALVPNWFWYRRLYGPFFFFLASYAVLTALDNSIAGSPDGGSPLALLFIVQVVVQGWVADRLLYRKARRAAATPATLQQLARMGAPNQWAIWVPLGLLLIGVAAAILIPMLAVP